MKTLKYFKELARANGYTSITDAVTQAKRDRDRLDWLCQSDHWFSEPASGKWTPESFRDAIDDAMAKDGSWSEDADRIYDEAKRRGMNL